MNNQYRIVFSTTAKNKKPVMEKLNEKITKWCNDNGEDKIDWLIRASKSFK